MLEKDIILICKGHYNRDKYKNEYEAMVGYYHKHYGMEDDILDTKFITELFLKRTLYYILKDDKDETHYFFNCLFKRRANDLEFYDELFLTIVDFIRTRVIKVRCTGGLIYKEKFDFSEYEQEDTMELREVI